MKDLVVGLIFDNKNRVLLINKLRPEFQKGKLNGVGGKVEDGESHLNAIIRETKEETNLDIKDWVLYSQANLKDFKISFFYTTLDSEEIEKYESLTDEILELHDINNLPDNVLEDIKSSVKYITNMILL